MKLKRAHQSIVIVTTFIIGLIAVGIYQNLFITQSNGADNTKIMGYRYFPNKKTLPFKLESFSVDKSDHCLTFNYRAGNEMKQLHISERSISRSDVNFDNTNFNFDLPLIEFGVNDSYLEKLRTNKEWNKEYLSPTFDGCSHAEILSVCDVSSIKLINVQQLAFK